ncbi:peroxiredoxin [Candidatus Uhrbacteria bacterium]|nr:peroxiredoxin [Candidatus Uhrbacteria bacterium]
MVKTAASGELKLGDLAPDFAMSDQDGNEVKLSSYRGKHNIVLVFYPGDMTPGCTLQLCAIRDDWSKFIQADTLVFGVNHGDEKSHAKFIQAHEFPFPLLIDKDKKVSAKYGAVRSIFGHKVIKRSVVGVDKNGKIVFLKRGMPKDADVIKAMLAAK